MFSKYEHLFAEIYLQGFKTGKQKNTLPEKLLVKVVKKEK